MINRKSSKTRFCWPGGGTYYPTLPLIATNDVCEGYQNVRPVHRYGSYERSTEAGMTSQSCVHRQDLEFVIGFIPVPRVGALLVFLSQSSVYAGPSCKAEGKK